MKMLRIIAVLFFLYMNGCDSVDSADVSGEWLIPADQVFDGGPGRDGIPSIDNPQFTNINDAPYLNDDDLVIGIKIGGVIRAYPHPILDWHEIVNDEISGKKIALTYCPLTGSAIAWERNGVVSNSAFGVSGLLYNSNLIPYDRGSKSNWSQMKLQCVNGTLIGNEITTAEIVETNYSTWRELYPASKLLSSNTGFGRQYGVYPYGSYKSNDDLIFPVSGTDSRLQKKDRVLGIISGGQSIVFPISSFTNAVEVKIVTFSGENFVVIGSAEKNIAVAFKRNLPDGSIPEISSSADDLPIVMEDSEGNKFNLFGEVVEGPKTGESLMQAKSFISYWFAWAAFYPNALISQ